MAVKDDKTNHHKKWMKVEDNAGGREAYSAEMFDQPDEDQNQEKDTSA